MESIIKLIRHTQSTGQMPSDVSTVYNSAEFETFVNLVSIATDSGLDDVGLGKLIGQTVLSKYAV